MTQPVMNSAPQWYLGSQSSANLLAGEAFRTAVEIFKDDFTKDTDKKNIAGRATTLEDLSIVVQNAKSKYEAKKGSHKVIKWLRRFSLRVVHYGNVLDVLVQHHPEYVSLAWGAFKLLFMIIENNEKLLTTLCKTLSQIAESLPRVELSAILYPTERMKTAVVKLYVHVINFLIRAKSWFDESTLRRIVNAFARPSELRYDDIVQEISICTAEIDHLSTVGSRAEQRDMHLEQRDMHIKLEEISRNQTRMESLVSEVRRLCVENQTLSSGAFLDTNRRLTDIQLNSIMESLQSARDLDPLKILSQCQHAQRAQMKTTGKNSPLSIVAKHPKFKTWQSTALPTLVMLKGDYKTRNVVKNISINVVQILRRHHLPVVWVLQPPLRHAQQCLSTVDLIRNIIHQILRLNLSSHTEKSLSLSCAQFQTAQTPGQWFDLLAAVVEPSSVLYIIIDIEAIDVRLLHTNGAFSWLSSFCALIKALEQRQARPNLKILLLGHTSAARQERNNLSRFGNLVLPIRNVLR